MDADLNPTDSTNAMLAALTGDAPTTQTADDIPIPTETPAQTKPTAPAAKTTVTETPKEEEDYLKSLLEGKATVQPGTEAEGRKPRDYTGLDEKERKIFANMSREAYEDLYPKYLEYKDLAPHKDKIPKITELEKARDEALAQRWFDHPNAFQLDERYSKAQDQINQVSGIYDHFARQLDAVNAGAKEVVMLDIVNGKFVQVKQPVDASTQRRLIEEMSAAKSEQTKLEASLAEVKNDHNRVYGSHRQNVEKLTDQLVGKYKSILEKPANEELAKFPAYFRKDPVAPLVANLIALVTLTGKALEKQIAQKPARDANAAAAQLAPPTRDQVPAAVTGGKPKYSAAEFKQLQEQGLV